MTEINTQPSSTRSMALQFLLTTSILLSTSAFVPSSLLSGSHQTASELHAKVFEPLPEMDDRTKKSTGYSFLPEEAIARAQKGSPIEKFKLGKDPSSLWVDIYDYAAKIRAGEMSWDDVEKADLDNRLKFVGMLHRNKRTPGQFMMRLKVPNGIVTADQLRFYATCVEPYGDDQGVIDITTRANIQLRGVKIEDTPAIIDGMHARNQTTFQSALDSVRNMVGHPLSGIDTNEMVDTREICNALNDLVSLDPVSETRGNPMWANLPRKFNIAVSGSRDDFAHTHINDIGLQPCPHGTTGEMGFNVVLGGYMSIKRVAESIDGNMWIKADAYSVTTFCEAILRIFRDEGERKDRQKARLMWLVEKYGAEDYKKAVTAEVESYGRGVTVEDAQPPPTDKYERRETLLGVHEQPQENKVFIGVLVPAGRISVQESRDLADLADKYSEGEARLTVEQNVLFPNIDKERVEEFLNEPALTGTRLNANPGLIEGHTISCTGAQFCGLALIETKSNAESISQKLEELLVVEKPVRIHWTGCPNSCGQVQAADIGIMGAPARKEDPETGKKIAVPGCSIFVGGTIGEHGHLSLEPYKKGIPLAEDELIPELVAIMKEKFGAVDRTTTVRKRDMIKKIFSTST